MTKEAIQHIQETTIKPEERILEKEGRMFAIDSWGNATELLKPADRVVESKGRLFEIDSKNNLTELSYREQRTAKYPLVLQTLTGLIDYIRSNLDRVDEKLYLHIASEKAIELVGALNIDSNRENLINVRAIIPRFEFNHFYDSEEMNISLQSKYVQTHDREILLQVLGNLVEENVKNTGDDGVSQSVIMRKGVTSREEVKVPNPVTLAPYRTFVEVNQPESKFIFRMREGSKAAIFEADGGAWRNEAIHNVKVFLMEHLSEEIESGKITILA